MCNWCVCVCVCRWGKNQFLDTWNSWLKLLEKVFLFLLFFCSDVINQMWALLASVDVYFSWAGITLSSWQYWVLTKQEHALSHWFSYLISWYFSIFCVSYRLMSWLVVFLDSIRTSKFCIFLCVCYTEIKLVLNIDLVFINALKPTYSNNSM